MTSIRFDASYLGDTTAETPPEYLSPDLNEDLTGRVHLSAFNETPTIVIDTREKKPYCFESYEINTVHRALTTGDYAICGYEETAVIERKTKDDFLRSITRDRDRFKAEVKRAAALERPMPIIVEASWSEFENGNYRRDVRINSIEGTVKVWDDAYNIEWHFVDGRGVAELRTLEMLARWQTEL